MEHIVPELAIEEHISGHFVSHRYMVPSEGVLCFNDANRRARTAMLKQVWLHLTVMNLEQ